MELDEGIDSMNDSESYLNTETPPAKSETTTKKSDEYEDILESGDLFRKVLKQGTGDRRPQHGDLVTVRVEGVLDDGEKVDCCDELPFLIGDSEVIPALELGVSFMAEGEIDSIKTTSRFAYGKVGKDEEIPPNASITYTLELLSMEEGPDPEKMSLEDRLKWVDKKRSRGNYYFQREEFDSAIDVYQRALKLLEPHADDKDDDRRMLTEAGATLYNNLGAAQVKTEAWEAAIQSLSRCLRVQPGNVKALFRMARAYMGQRDYANAIVRLSELQELDPENKAVQKELSRARGLLKRENETSKEIYKKMFSKPMSAQDQKSKSFVGWIKDHCTMTNGALTAAAAIGVLLVSHTLIARLFN